MNHMNKKPPAVEAGGSEAKNENNQSTDKLAARLKEMQEELWAYWDEKPDNFPELVYAVIGTARLRHPGFFLQVAEAVLREAADVLEAERKADSVSLRHKGVHFARTRRREKIAQANGGKFPDPARAGLWFLESLLAAVRDHADCMGKLENRAYATACFPRLTKRERAELSALAEGTP
jgi:hypothetical protein